MLTTRAALALMLALSACSRSRSHEPNGKEAQGCAPGTVLVLGACVAPEIARGVCGPSLLPLAGGCAPRPPCKRGEARDGAGECIAASRVRALTEGTSLTLGDDDDVGCAADGGEGERERERGEELVERAGELACVPRPSPVRSCPLGMVDDLGKCVRVKNGEIVDAALWLRAVIGPSGGLGTPLTCRALERSSKTPREDIEVVLRFVDNDVSQLELQARPHDPAVELALQPLANAARALGGAAQTSEAATRIRCTKKQPASAGPRAIPRQAPGQTP